MAGLEKDHSDLRIVIPISDKEQIDRYQKGLLGLLRRIEVDNCDPALKENLKSVYELLSYLKSKDEA